MKITTLLFDSSWTIMFPKDRSYSGEINKLHFQLKEKPGYSFFDYFELSQELLDYLKKIKSKVSVNMFTAGVVQDLPEVREKLDLIFEKIYSKTRVGKEKTDPSAYEFIAKDLGKNPKEILFIDDSVKNLEAAHLAGLQIVQFKSNDIIIKEIERRINE